MKKRSASFFIAVFSIFSFSCDNSKSFQIIENIYELSGKFTGTNGSRLSRLQNGGKIKVFILAGQSNMAGAGTVEPNQSHLDKNGGMGTLRYLVQDRSQRVRYAHLVDASGDWSVRNDVWIADLNASGALSVQGKTHYGPDLQFAHVMGDFYQDQVLIIKTAWGGKSLYTDFRPPSSGGTVGPFYTAMITRVHEVLNNIGQHVQGYNGQGYEIAGFGWHQGWNDRVNQTANNEYQENMVNFINDVRDEFNSPNLPFVVATTGMQGWNETHHRALSLMNAQLAAPNDSRLKSGHVTTVETRGYWRDPNLSPANQAFHWNQNGETYFLIGNGMGTAMVDLLLDQGSLSIYEAEDYTAKYNCTVATSPAGYLGTGFINYGGTGSWTEWNNIQAPKDGLYRLTFRYTNGGSERNSTAFVNGVDMGKVAFAPTGDWVNYKNDSITVEITKGMNRIRLRANARFGGPNLDRITVEFLTSSANTSVYQAEDYSDKYGTRIATDHDSYTGSGFIDYGGTGSWTEWNNIHAPETGEYRLNFKYTNGGASRTSMLTLNGVDVGDVAFPPTGDWITYKTDSITVNLTKGMNRIRLTAKAGQGGPNLDRIEVEPLTGASKYEAENYSAKFNSGFSSSVGGYSGRGFIDFGGPGSWMEWNRVQAPEDGDYRLTFRYANGGGSRTSTILVNGMDMGTVAFANTGGWSSWKTDTITVSLTEGTNLIRVRSIGHGPNLDRMDVEFLNSRPETIDAVFFAQNHVLSPEDDLFKLVSNAGALLKVHVISPEPGTDAPQVNAMLTLNGQTQTLALNGPSTLPGSIPIGPGLVDHNYEHSFAVMIPAAWVQPGLKVEIRAGVKSRVYDNLKIGAPNVVVMTMFDVNYFKSTPGDYETGWLEELTAKWPVSDIELRRIPSIVFEELTIPPRANLVAARVKSKEEYKQITGGNFDGEQAAALHWKSALKAAAGTGGRVSLYYVNIYGVHAGGQAGGFGGVGNGTSEGILHHELGHALSLPHWGNNAAYPYRGDMHGFPAPSSQVHVGPTWAFDVPTGTFIPPIVQAGASRGTPGTYKADPMQGGGVGDQEPGFIFRHFSDYSVNQMRNYLEGHIVVWNNGIGSYASWDPGSNAYTKAVSNNGVQFPMERNVQVISLMAGVSSVTNQANIAYPPIGPYKSGLIETFDPRVSSQRSRADQIYCPAAGCDVSLRFVQGGQTKILMLPIARDPNANPLSGGSFQTRAVNIRAGDGEVTRVELISTPDAEKNGLPGSPGILHTWSK